MHCVLRFTALASVLAVAVGCGSDDKGLAPVSGVVRLDTKPIEHAVLTFTPEGDTKSVGGTGVTGADGKYEVTGPQGQKGLAPGTYKVVISRRLRKDGTPPPPDVGEMDSDAKETLAEIYSSSEKTTLRVTIEPGKPQDFDLKSGKK